MRARSRSSSRGIHFPRSSRASDRTYGRKVLEMVVACEIEKRASKNQDPRAVSQSRLLRLRLLRSGGGRAGLLRQARQGSHALRSRHSGGAAEEPVAIFRRGAIARPASSSATTCSSAPAGAGADHAATYEATMKEDLVVKNRRPIHQESYAADLVAQQVEKLVGRRQCRLRRLPDLHDDRRGVAKEGGDGDARPTGGGRAARGFRASDLRAV